MILSGTEIENQVKKKNIFIYPFLKSNLNPNSYNYRLGKKLLKITDKVIDPKKRSRTKEIVMDEKGYLLEPGKLYLGHTMESIGSREFVVNLIGRSSIGRLGLFLQITADLGNLGKPHCWTLELTVVQPLWVYPGMKIGQVCFWKPLGRKKHLYLKKYSKYSDPHSSEFFNEMIIN